MQAAAHLGPEVPLDRLMAIHRAKSQQHFVLGEFLEARAEGEHALGLARQAGDRVGEAGALASIGFATLWAQDFDGALSYAAQAIEVAAAAGARAPLGSGYLTTGYVHALSGRLPEATETLVRGNLARAREFADRCLDVATQTKSRKYLVRSWRLRGEIARAGRQWAESEAAMREALTVARAIGNPTQLWRTHLAYGHLHAERKNHAEAGRAYRAAGEVVDRIKASLTDPRLRASFEGSPRIREVYDLSAG